MSSLQPKEKQPRTGPRKPAPEWWNEQQLSLSSSLSPEDMRLRWAALSNIGRSSAVQCFRLKQSRLASVQARLATIDSTTTLTAVPSSRALTAARNFVAKGGRTMHPSKAAYFVSKRECALKKSKLRSAETLEFRRKHASYCSIPGCVLGAITTDSASSIQSDRNHAGTDAINVLLDLINLDHIDPKTKIDVVTALSGPLRLEELKKTQPLCLWHHFLKTREEKGIRSLFDVTHDYRVVALIKTFLGCQHPEHDSMKYASLVPKSSDDPRMFNFLEISHIRRGNSAYSGLNINSTIFRHILGGLAVVHCKFCHALYTVCERHHLTPESPYLADQYNVLKRISPQFVQQFEESTAGFPWATEAQRMTDQRVSSLRKNRATAAAAAEQASVDMDTVVWVDEVDDFAEAFEREEDKDVAKINQDSSQAHTQKHKDNMLMCL